MTSLTLRFIFAQPLKQWLTGEKRGVDRNTKFEYLKNQETFSDEMKTFSILFERPAFSKK